MFTLEQIKNAHAKVKSGADFPGYIQELKILGVLHYTTFVADGHTDYFGENEEVISSLGMYEVLKISEVSDVERFKKKLKEHQEGRSDYRRFCEDCAESGVVKWVVDLGEMSCRYFDGSEGMMLEERIPG